MSQKYCLDDSALSEILLQIHNLDNEKTPHEKHHAKGLQAALQVELNTFLAADITPTNAQNENALCLKNKDENIHSDQFI